MADLNPWCRIVTVEGVTVLFYQEWNTEQDIDEIHAIVKTGDAQADMKIGKDKAFLQWQFDAYASEKGAKAVIDAVRKFGLEPEVANA